MRRSDLDLARLVVRDCEYRLDRAVRLERDDEVRYYSGQLENARASLEKLERNELIDQAFQEFSTEGFNGDVTNSNPWGRYKY